MSKETYQEGQVWSYKTRPQDPHSKLYIVKIEADENLETIYHLYIDGLNMKNPRIKEGIQTTMPHIPASEKTLNESIIQIETGEAIDSEEFNEGYLVWKKEFDKGGAGIWTIPVSEIISYVEEVITESE